MDDRKNNLDNKLEDVVKDFNNDIFEATSSSLENLNKTYSYYREMINYFNNGKSSVELKKKFILKALDEGWINVIEDVYSSIDTIIRKPGYNLEDIEEIKAIELTHKVTSQSVVHLSQHTDLINEIKKDGTVMPAKLLNVYQDETMLTYENKFINTLIQRLYAFIMMRYDAVGECGKDEQITTFTYNQEFVEGDKKGKINVVYEISQPPKNGEDVGNGNYSNDLWQRATNLVEWIKSAICSPFCMAIGKNYIKPPIIRTNKLLKNVDFQKCVTLWDFLENYDNTGYDASVFEKLEDVNASFLKPFCDSVVAQYVLMQNSIDSDFSPRNALDSYQSAIFQPKIKEKLDPFQERDYDYRDIKPIKDPASIIKTGEEDQIDFAIRVALAADEAMFKNDVEVKEEDTYKYRYVYSFLARLILTQHPAQDFYSFLKNKILSFKGIKNRISWKHEMFRHGRNPIAKFAMKGKTLCVYLPLNPDNYKDTKLKYYDLRDSKVNGQTPFMMKIKSKRNANQVLELILFIIDSYNLKPNKDYLVRNYHCRYISPEKLCVTSPILARKIGEEIPNVEEEIYRYNFSFMARLILAQDPCQNYYSIIKNKLLSYKKVNNRLSWKHETFTSGRDILAKLTVRGKTLCVFFPFNPDDFADAKFKFYDVSDVKAHEDTPFVIKIKNNKYVKIALNLIEKVMEQYNKVEIADFDPVEYEYEERTKEQLCDQVPALAKRIDDLLVFFDDEGFKNSKKRVLEEDEDDDDKVIDEVDDSTSNDLLENEDTTLLDNIGDADVAVEENNLVETQTIYQYEYSFMGRLILAQNPAQEYYSLIKNKLLSYIKVNNRLSWRHEAFNSGRNLICRLTMKGKTLCVHLPLDPANYQDANFKCDDVSDSKYDEDTPLVIRIKNNKYAKIACMLIEDIMAKLEKVVNEEFIPSEYKYDYMTKDELCTLNPPLARLIVRTVEITSEEKEDEINESITNAINETPIALENDSIEKPVEEEAPVVEDEVIESEDDDDNVDDEADDDEVEIINGIKIRYSISFVGRLCICQNPTQEYYSLIKNKLLSYKKVNNRLSWKKETFNSGRELLAKLTIRGKTLCLYLALNPSDYENAEFKYIDASNVKSSANTPLVIKVKNNKYLKIAYMLIEEVMNKHNKLINDKFESQEYKYEYHTKEELCNLDPALAKCLYSNESTPAVEENVTEAPVTEEQVVEETPVTEVVEEPAVEELQDDTPVEETVVEEQTEEAPLVEEEVVEDIPVAEVVEELVVEEVQEETPAVEENVTEAPVTEEQVVEDISVAEVIEEPVVGEVQEETPVDETVVEEQTEEASIVEEQVVEETPVTEVVEELVVEEVQEETPVEETIVEKTTEEVENEEPEEDELESEDESDDEEEQNEESDDDEKDDNDSESSGYQYTFKAHLILSGEECQTFYSELKNLLLSYKKVHSRIRRKYEMFNLGRDFVAYFYVRGKSLRIKLNLNKEEYKKTYNLVNSKDAYVWLKVKKNKHLNQAIALIKEMMDKLHVGQIKNPNYVDYHQTKKTKEELIQEGLIKKVGK